MHINLTLITKNKKYAFLSKAKNGIR